MHSSLLTLCCVLTVLQRGSSCSAEVYEPQYHQSVPYTGEITQNIERGEGLQEAEYNPTVSQIILDGQNTGVTSRRVECNPVYTQEAPYSGVFNQNISTAASGVQKLAYQPTFNQEEQLRNFPAGCAEVAQNAPHETTYLQDVGVWAVGEQCTLIAPGFRQSALPTRPCMGPGEDSPRTAAYSQNVPISTNQSQAVGGNGTGYQSLDVRPSFSQSAGDFWMNQDRNSNTTFVQENCFAGNMSQVINDGGKGVQRSGYAPKFEQNEIRIVCGRNANCYPEDDKEAGMSGAFHQNGVYNNEMRQVIYPGGSGLQTSHFAPVFMQNNKVVRRKLKKVQAKKASNGKCCKPNTCPKSNNVCATDSHCKSNTCEPKTCSAPNAHCEPIVCRTSNTFCKLF